MGCFVYGYNLTTIKFTIMDEKIKWCLEHQFNEFYLGLIVKAIKSDKVSLEDFANGYDAIRHAQWDGEREFIPEEFENL